MTLSKTRIELVGESPYAYEREAIQYVIEQLPNADPYMLWGLLELPDPSTGRLYEIDLLVLGYSALYLIEVKSGPGVYEGSFFDWTRTPPEGASRYMEAPQSLANHKAKVLASRLRAKIKDPPFVQSLVFLSASDVKLKLSEEGRTGVVTRADVARALTFGEFPGANGRQRPRVDRAQQRDVAAALKSIGIKARAGKAYVGDWELGELLADGGGFQDRAATHRTRPNFHKRARIYLVPEQTSVESRQQLHRAAAREAEILYELRDHANVLAFTDFVENAPLGPTVLFDAFEGGLRLDAFLRQNPDLSFSDRVSIIEQVGLALSFCHKRGLRHGAISPESVLVRRRVNGGGERLEVKLFNFQLGWGSHVQGTVHRSALVSEPAAVYTAPELRDDPLSGGNYSDVFSLGALAYLVLTGAPPASSGVELDARISREGFLDPRASSDNISEDVAEAIRAATRLSIATRYDDAGSWVEFLLDAATKKDDARVEVSPLEARAGDELGGFTVVGVLGHGASSRVLEVERDSDSRRLALKVSLSEEHDKRLKAEARALQQLRHPRIVEHLETHTLSGRTCLLLTLAGDKTLQQRLTEEGIVSLDAAVRYGEDLLSALELLEEQGVAHRDIKPANLGVGTPSTRKEANHLTLFDFSLVDSPATDLAMGTAAYRDPFLRERGAWDAQADLWSAAVTLHEMLTGVRPRFSDLPAADAKLVLAAERFDPTVRDKLVAFFEKALARDAAHRFGNAEAMRLAWRRSMEASAPEKAPTRAATSESVEVSDEELSRIAPETPIEALPLSSIAKNALDRAGLTRADDLLRLPDNRLSAIRGIGSKVAKDVLRLRDRWRAQRASSDNADPQPFFPAYRGDDLSVERAGLDAPVANALLDAGLPTLSALAAAPESQVRVLAGRTQVDVVRLREVLEQGNKNANEREHPTTLEGWVDALLATRKKANQHARLLYGLDAPFVGQVDTSVKGVAAHLKVTTAAIYISLNKARAEWRAHPTIGELLERCHRVVDAAGGALPLMRAADELAALLPHERLAPEAHVRASAAALLRIGLELEREQAGGLTLARTPAGEPWVVASSELVEPLRRLGETADALAARPVLASPGEVHRALGESVAETPLAQLAPERLVEIGALASKGAARSTRLELYPRGLSAARALELTAGVLTGQLTPEDIRQRVLARYPHAAELPGRPALDELVEKLGLHWDEASQKYGRPGHDTSTSLHTSFMPTQRGLGSLTSQPKAMDDEAYQARDFDDRIASAIERRDLRVLGVRADLASLAAVRLGERLGCAPLELDKALLDEIARLMIEKKIQGALVDEADRMGPTGGNWPRLVTLLKNGCRFAFQEALAAHQAAALGAARASRALSANGLSAIYRRSLPARRRSRHFSARARARHRRRTKHQREALRARSASKQGAVGIQRVASQEAWRRSRRVTAPRALCRANRSKRRKPRGDSEPWRAELAR